MDVVEMMLAPKRLGLKELSTSRLVAIMTLINDAFTDDLELISAAVVIRAELQRRTNGRFDYELSGVDHLERCADEVDYYRRTETCMGEF